MAIGRKTQVGVVRVSKTGVMWVLWYQAGCGLYEGDKAAGCSPADVEKWVLQ